MPRRIKRRDTSTTVRCASCGVSTLKHWAKTLGWTESDDLWCCDKAVCRKEIVEAQRVPRVVYNNGLPSRPKDTTLPRMTIEGGSLKDARIVRNMEQVEQLIAEHVIPHAYREPISRAFFQSVPGVELIPASMDTHAHSGPGARHTSPSDDTSPPPKEEQEHDPEESQQAEEAPDSDPEEPQPKIDRDQALRALYSFGPRARKKK